MILTKSRFSCIIIMRKNTFFGKEVCHVKKRLPLLIILVFALFLCSCTEKNDKADISLLSPFYFEGEEIKASFVNPESIRFSDYIKCNISFETEDKDGEIYEESESYIPHGGVNRLLLYLQNGETRTIVLEAIEADELVVKPRGEIMYAVGEPLDISDFEIYGLLGESRVALPESSIETYYDFSAEGETEVEFYCGGFYAEVTVMVRGEYIPELDENMCAPDGILYETNEKGAVLKNGRAAREKISVPRAVTVGGKEYPVYAIADFAFRSNQNITSVSCPFVSEIGAGAFYECTQLKSVALPQKTCAIGANCFAYCQRLSSVRLPEENTRIEDGIFSDCGYLCEVYIPESTVYIGHYAFARCDFLESAALPSSLEYIGDGAFKDCSFLSGCIVIGAGVNYIGDEAFLGCDSLEYLVVPASPEYIGENAFAADSLFVYTAEGKTTARYCMKNEVNYTKWQYGTLGIISFKEEYDLGDEIDVTNDFVAVLFTENKICRVYGEPEYNFAISGTRRADLSVFGYSASWYCNVSYAEIMITETTDSRGAVYALDHDAAMARLIALPAVLSSGEVYRFESDVYVLPTTVIYHGEEYAVTEIGEGVFAGRSDIRAVFLHENVQSIGKEAFNNCSALEVFSIATSISGWINIDDDNFKGVSADFSYVCILKRSAPHIWATQHQIEAVDFESAPHYNEYFNWR